MSQVESEFESEFFESDFWNMIERQVWNDKDMYKDDWDKAHMIILAFSRNTCIDVTMDYADDMTLVRQRRDFSDSTLRATIQSAVLEHTQSIPTR